MAGSRDRGEQEEKGEGMIQNIVDKSLYFGMVILYVIFIVVPGYLLIAFLEVLSFSFMVVNRMKLGSGIKLNVITAE